MKSFGPVSLLQRLRHSSTVLACNGATDADGPTEPENIEWLTDDQASLRLYEQVVSFSRSSSNWRERGEGWPMSQNIRRRKAWSSIYHSTHFAQNNRIKIIKEAFSAVQELSVPCHKQQTAGKAATWHIDRNTKTEGREIAILAVSAGGVMGTKPITTTATWWSSLLSLFHVKGS